MLRITLAENGFALRQASAAVVASGLKDFVVSRVPSPFGATATAVQGLEDIAGALDLGLCTAERLKGHILESLREGASFAIPELAPEHVQFIAAYQLVVTADELSRRCARHFALPEVEGALDGDGLGQMLARGVDAVDLAEHVCQMASRFAEMQIPAPDLPADRDALQAVVAFFSLLRRAVLGFCEEASLRPLVRALEEEEVQVDGRTYDGLTLATAATDTAGLLPVTPESIVGNQEYLRAGLRLAMDVAAYDFEAARNPKKLNPILFALGKPGCGKTVTAHAVGNEFLAFCRQREIPAQFVVIRRTDWASSYQNASAMNLVRIFEEQIQGFDGVSGVYWPDIDTAFASRDSQQLRMEEKNNLGAAFGVFDGTLLPKDGRWFMLCDANNLHMDEATISRIAQNPMRVDGPTTAEHYETLLREILLADVAASLELSDAEWGAVAAVLVEHDASGRNVASIAGNIRTHIQDFDYPAAYFEASADEREAMVAGLARACGHDEVMGFVRDFVSFRQSAEDQAAEAQFRDEVEAMVRQLNASRTAKRVFEQS